MSILHLKVTFKLLCISCWEISKLVIIRYCAGNIFDLGATASAKLFEEAGVSSHYWVWTICFTKVTCPNEMIYQAHEDYSSLSRMYNKTYSKLWATCTSCTEAQVKTLMAGAICRCHSWRQETLCQKESVPSMTFQAQWRGCVAIRTERLYYLSIMLGQTLCLVGKLLNFLETKFAWFLLGCGVWEGQCSFESKTRRIKHFYQCSSPLMWPVPPNKGTHIFNLQACFRWQGSW